MKPVRIQAVFCLVLAATWVVAGSLPNYVLIMADDMGYAGLSCYGNEYGIKTPNLDRMAEAGVRFTDFHSNGVVCSPTRAALLTGRYQQRTGISRVVQAKNDRNKGLSLEEFTLAEMLKSGGYHTAIFGKWHEGYSSMFNPVNQGFDEFIGFVSGNVDCKSHLDVAIQEDWWKQGQLHPEEGYQTTLIGNHTLDFIERNKQSPFFVYVAFGAPHAPIQGPNDPAVRGEGAVSQHDIDMERAYREMVESLDKEVGRICSRLEELGLAENTFIFFCSDNGAAKKWSGSSSLKGRKGMMSEGGHRVPAIAYWPGTIPPAVTDQTAMTVDLYTTYAALSGISVPEQVKLDGTDLFPLLKTGKALPQRTFFWSMANAHAVRRGSWKYVKEKKGAAALYDLSADLGEKNDLSKKNPEMFQQLETAFNKWIAEVDANPTGPQVDPDVPALPPKKKKKKGKK